MQRSQRFAFPMIKRGGLSSPTSQPRASVFSGSTAIDIFSRRWQVLHSKLRSSKPRSPGEIRAKPIRCLQVGHIGRSGLELKIRIPVTPAWTIRSRARSGLSDTGLMKKFHLFGVFECSRRLREAYAAELLWANIAAGRSGASWPRAALPHREDDHILTRHFQNGFAFANLSEALTAALSTAASRASSRPVSTPAANARRDRLLESLWGAGSNAISAVRLSCTAMSLRSPRRSCIFSSAARYDLRNLDGRLPANTASKNSAA